MQEIETTVPLRLNKDCTIKCVHGTATAQGNVKISLLLHGNKGYSELLILKGSDPGAEML